MGMMTAWLTIAMLAGVLVLTGCVASNEGAIDLRRTMQATIQVNAKRLTLMTKNFSLGPEARITENDSISIHLRSAFIHSFREGPNPFRGFRKNGEIAIVANAFEMAANRELDLTNVKAGRLVFYSDDVSEGQFLNFNNMPIYGPITYRGAPVAFRMSIFELDVTSEQAKGMLVTLAQVGSIAYPPASPVLGVLNSVGQAMLSSDQDDTEFRYTMVLDPKGGFDLLNHFTLEAGNYVLVRSEDRTTPIQWDKLVLDENEGRLYWVSASGEARLPYKENTYVVVEVNKNTSSIEVDLSQHTFEELLNALRVEDRKRAVNLTGITTALTEVALQRSQTVAFNRAKELTQRVKTETDDIEKRTAARSLLEMLAASLTTEGKPKAAGHKPPLSESQVEYLLGRLRKLSVDKTAAAADQLTALAIALAYKKGPTSQEFEGLLQLIAP